MAVAVLSVALGAVDKVFELALELVAERWSAWCSTVWAAIRERCVWEKGATGMPRGPDCWVCEATNVQAVNVALWASKHCCME